MTEEQMGKGGIVSPVDERDFKYCGPIGGAGEPFDWVSGYDVEDHVGKMPVKDQQVTSACGGFAWSSLSYVLDTSAREEKSEKFIYAQTAVPGGGSNGRVNSALCTNKGVCTKALCPLPEPLTEANITKNDITPEAFKNALTNRERVYFVENHPSIETMAQMIRDSGGAVLLLWGQNNGTWLSKKPQTPNNPTAQNTWAHFVFAGKAKEEKGKKYIGILNSWGKEVGDSGWQWLDEDYFKSKCIWEAWAMTELGRIDFVFTKTLRLGFVGLDAKMLQYKLGMPDVDFVFGLKTLSAVKKFQSEHGLKPDGIVGPATNAALNSLA